MSILNKEDIKELLERGVGELFDPDGEFQKKLETDPSGVIIKFGVDPTRPDIHLGHAVVLRKLRKFQDLGCKVVFLVGDFTSLIGDPTGKSKVRPELGQKEIEENMKTFLDQVGKILLTDPGVFSWIRNSDWFISISDLVVPQKITYTDNSTGASVDFQPNSFLAKSAVYDETRMQRSHLKKPQILDVTLRTFLSTLRFITHGKLIGRDMFQERIKSGNELYMHEMLYPVLQGIDSSIIARIYGSCDLEVGGTDQTFNMLVGRDIMKFSKQEPQAVLSFKLLEGLDGKEKMSKSLENYVAITDEPNDMFGKIMSLPDSLITKYFELCTYTPISDIEEISKELSSGKINPRDIKMRLAKEIVEIYHGRKQASDAEKNFVNVFSEGKIPSEIEVVSVSKGSVLKDVLLEKGLVSSKSDFNRLVKSGAIELAEEKTRISDTNFKLESNSVVRIGKNRFIKITVE